MEYTRLGESGLQVSRITVGCMSWGDGGRTRPWTKDEAFADQVIAAALEAGVNFFDTANVYSAGTSEEYTGRTLWKHADREDVVLATKVFNRMRPGPNGAGLSRKAIMQEIDASLRRLETDYVDLYQIHRFDPDTPVEETMEALHDVVKAGKARYLGASSMYAWQFATLQHAADLGGWTRFVSMQNHYNLIYREEEREMLPLCEHQGVGVIPWSPLARGRLTRLAVVRRDQEQGVGPQLLGLPRELDAVGGVVAADAGHHGGPVADGVLDHAQDVAGLGDRAGRALPRRTAHDDAVVPVSHQVLGDRCGPVEVDRIVAGERRGHRRQHPPEGCTLPPRAPVEGGGRHGLRLPATHPGASSDVDRRVLTVDRRLLTVGTVKMAPLNGQMAPLNGQMAPVHMC
jgi:aryl-alcohol dehydrogenase-like predicted oxidoreductase